MLELFGGQNRDGGDGSSMRRAVVDRQSPTLLLHQPLLSACTQYHGILSYDSILYRPLNATLSVSVAVVLA